MYSYGRNESTSPRLSAVREERSLFAVGLSLFRSELPRFSYFSSHGRALSEGGVGAAGFRVVSAHSCMCDCLIKEYPVHKLALDFKRRRDLTEVHP